MIQLFKTHIYPEVYENVKRILESGWLGLGPEVSKFEEEFANYLGAKYCIALNSGTAALQLAVESLYLPENSRIITTPNTFVSTNHVLLQAGLKPVFADIDETGNISSKSIGRILDWSWPEGKGIQAIMIVHYGGQPADLDEIYQMANEREIPIIEDCAHACGATYKGKRIGKDSRLACFSFHAVKNLGIGDGGALVTNNENVYEFAKRMRWLGINKSTLERSTGPAYSWDYNVPEIGYKSHMCDVMAAIARGQLLHLDEGNQERQDFVDWYKMQLQDIPQIKPLLLKSDRISSNHLFVVRFEESELREKAMVALKKNDIQFGFHYKPNYRYPMYKDYARDKGHEMRMFELTALTLPLHLELYAEDVDYIVKILKEVI